MANESIPFDKSYVLHVTAKHMLKSVNISIDKTSDRMAEFTDHPTKAREVFETLCALHNLRKSVEGIINGIDRN